MGKSIDTYLETIERLEPEIAVIDTGAFNASAAISLKRIADAMEFFVKLAKEEQSERYK